MNPSSSSSGVPPQSSQAAPDLPDALLPIMNELSKAMSSSSSSGCDTAALHLILGSLVESTCGELLDACCVSTNPPNVDTVGSETISALHTVNMLLSDQAETDFDAVYPSAAECVEIITKNSRCEECERTL